MFVGVGVGVCMQEPAEPEEGTGSPGAGVIGSCGPPDVGIGNMNKCTSSRCSYGLHRPILCSHFTDRLGLSGHK